MRHTRASVRERTLREFAELDRLVTRLRPPDWKRPVPRPPDREAWTVKDALVHILYWKVHSIRVFRGERRPPELRGLGVEQINRVIYERWRRRRPAEVVAWHRRVHAEVLELLASLPDEWFGRRPHGAEWPADFDGHSAAHRVKDIEAGLGDASGDRRARTPTRRPRRPPR